VTYELRVYHANPGKISALLTRFRDHTVGLFAKHGMDSIGYWVPENTPDDLIYVLQHSGDPAKNWESFLNDPEWIEVKANSEVDGVLVASIDAQYMSATDFSALK
jgi:hypothetical protein